MRLINLITLFGMLFHKCHSHPDLPCWVKHYVLIITESHANCTLQSKETTRKIKFSTHCNIILVQKNLIALY